MPFGDGTGPRGQGPLTGRGLGPCAGGKAYGRGFGRGYGRGTGRGYGRGFGFRGFPREAQAVPFAPYSAPVDLSPEEKLKILKAEKDDIAQELKAVEEEIKALQGKK